MAWLQSAPLVVFIFALGMVLLLAALGFGMAIWSGRITGALRGRTPVPVNALTEGYQLARGQAGGPLLAAPLSGRPCVWWEVRVWERVIGTYQDSDRSRDQRAEWSERRHDHSSRAIQCTQGFATCAVQPSGMTLTVPTEVRDWQGMQYPPEHRDPPAQPGTAFTPLTQQNSSYAIVGGKLQGDRYRYREEIIAPNSPLYVLGQVERVAPAQCVDDDAEPPVDPAFLKDKNSPVSKDARADEPPSPPDSEPAPTSGLQGDPDAFGHIGWSEEADRQHAADMRQAQWRIGPQKGQPYIVSALPPEQWQGMPQQAARGGWVMGTLFAALAAFLLWARFGAA